MATEDPYDLERVDREIRINELKHQAEELAGGEMTAWESEDCPADLAEQFWQQVVDYERAPRTCYFHQLEEAGVDLPPPHQLDDRHLKAKLAELIDRLARMRVFVSQTDHLSDRALYTRLWQDSLREEVPVLPEDEDSSWHIDLLSGGSAEDNYLYLKYYADEEWRRQWADNFPDDEIPAHEDPPYDRDRHLPQETYGQPADAEDGPG
jgi:hypothetical protein